MDNKVKELWKSMTSGEFSQEDINWYNKVIEAPERAFPIAIYPLIKKYMDNLRGKKVLVPSSGDNTAVFGFHLLGAKVTSCDITENQLENAKSVADKHGWDIEFICQDSMKLDKIKDSEYDLVYTSNGVHVWIDDLLGMYKNFNRVLKPGGYNIFFDTHPMGRPFDDDGSRMGELKIVKSYEDIASTATEDENVATYHWKTQHLVNAIASAEFHIKHMEEFINLPEDLDSHAYIDMEEDPEHPNYGKDMFDWRVNPWAALPQCLCLCSQKQ